MKKQQKEIKEFSKKGYCVVKISKEYIKDLKKLNNSIIKNIDNKLGKKKIELSDFHKIKLSDIELNNFRLDTIKLINKQKDLRKIIYKSLENFLDQLLGPDVVMQKNINHSFELFLAKENISPNITGKQKEKLVL